MGFMSTKPIDEKLINEPKFNKICNWPRINKIKMKNQ